MSKKKCKCKGKEKCDKCFHFGSYYFTGKQAKFQIFATALADVGDKEDILKTKYAI